MSLFLTVIAILGLILLVFFNIDNLFKIIFDHEIIVFVHCRSVFIKKFSTVCRSGETGVRLQYAHSRLFSLLQKTELEVDPTASTLPLVEEAAQDLVHVIGRYRHAIADPYL